ncbi:MAG TPA: glutamate--tRNA ligase [Candidatus Paceibacterota bacterium]
MPDKVVTRFAPSPTGHMHAGSYRTAFFAYLYARKHGGKFILRIEDTDKERSKEEYTEEIFKVFKTIGITYDEHYIQSQNLPRHRELLEKLVSEDKAYISKEEAKDGSGEIKEIVRLRNQNKVVTFNDLIRGPISTDTTDLGDFVIAKNVSEPLFHLAVVIDDHDEGVTHVIRAEEHISNTPRQILIHEALGFEIPNYAHLPLVLAPDKSKMSKRKGAVPVIEYLARGYLPEAILNAICLCGWNPDTDQELFTRAELEREFDLDKVQKAGAVFSEEKLDWFNREYIKKLSPETLESHVVTRLPDRVLLLPQYSEERLQKVIPNIVERISKFEDVTKMADSGELDFFFATPEIDKILILDKYEASEVRENLGEIIKLLTQVTQFDSESVKQTIWDYATEKGRGNVLWPMRTALSGLKKSPDPFTIAEVIGKEETIKRLEDAANNI